MTDETSKRFILWSDKHKQACLNFITRIPLEGACTYQVVISEYEKTRTTDQNARLWALYRLVADNTKCESELLHAPEWWHYRLACEWLPIAGTCRVKVGNQWVDAPVPKSTTKLSTAEMSDYQEKIINLLIQNGVELPEWVN